MVGGRLLGAGEASVSVFDAAVLHGDAYFETFRTYDGRPALMDAHIERLLSAINAAGYAGAPDAAQMRDEVLATIEHSGLDEAQVRVTVSRGVREHGLAAPARQATRIVAVSPLADAARQGGERPVAAKLVNLHGYSFPRKSANYQRAAGLVDELRDAGFDEGIVTDGGEVIEGLTTNVFAQLHDQLVTPPLGRCLPGVTRAAILAIAKSCDLEPHERRLSTDDLMAADAVMVSNSLIELRRVVRIGDTQLTGVGRESAHWRLLDALRRHYATVDA